MDSIFDYLIHYRISLFIWLFILIIITITLFILCSVITELLAEKIYNIYFNKAQDYKDYKKSEKLNDRLTYAITIIVTINFFTMLPLAYTNYYAYKDYLTTQITKNRYTVTQIAYDKKTVITDTGKKLQNDSGEIKTVKKPTNDKSKVGQSYYILEVYTPEKIKKLFNGDNKDKKKYKTKLIKYTYIKDYEQVSKQ